MAVLESGEVDDFLSFVLPESIFSSFVSLVALALVFLCVYYVS